MDALVNDLKAKHVDQVINLAAGAPDFFVPLAVKTAMHKALDENRTGYTKASGIDPLKQAVVNDLAKRLGLYYVPAQAVITPGGKQAVSLALMALLNLGDEAIIPAPYWVSYPAMVKIAGGVPKIYGPLAKWPWHDLKEVITPKTKVLIINSPNNPAGYVLEREDLEMIASIAIANDLWVISDEVYSCLVFGNRKHVSIAQLPGMQERTIIIDSGSKRFAGPGLRVGNAVGLQEVITAMGKLQGQFSGCPNSLGQAGLLAGFEQAEADVEKMCQEYERRCQELIMPFAQEMLAKHQGFSFLKPQGAFYFWFKLPYKYQGNCDTFCKNLLQAKLLGLVPGHAFGCPGWVRLSYAAAPQKVEQALKRLAEFFDE